MLVDGKWTKDWDPVQKSDEKGRFVRQVSSFRNWITPDGSAGPTGEGASRPRPGAIASMSRSSAPGPLAR